MSLTTIVTVHCDVCSYWVHTADSTAAQRRKRGWRRWQEPSGFRRDTCPKCTPTVDAESRGWA